VIKAFTLQRRPSAGSTCATTRAQQDRRPIVPLAMVERTSHLRAAAHLVVLASGAYLATKADHDRHFVTSKRVLEVSYNIAH